MSDPREHDDLEPDDGTVVVERDAPDDGTVVIERDAPDDVTVVVERDAPDEGTVVIERGAPAGAAPTIGGETPASSLIPAAPPASPAAGRPRRPARRIAITLPPVGSDGGRTAVDASGPGAIESYPRRELPSGRLPVPPLGPGVVPTRSADSATLPSVVRASRRYGRVAVLLVSLAVLVSAAGLVLVAFLAFAPSG